MCGHMHSPMCVKVRRQFEGVPGFSSGLYLLRYLSGLFFLFFMISTEFNQDYLCGSGFGTICWHLSRYRTEENDCPSSRIPQQPIAQREGLGLHRYLPSS